MHNLTKQLLDAVKNSNDENVDPFDLIKKYLSQKPNCGIYLHGNLSRIELQARIKKMDFALVPLVSRIYGSVPSKIFEYSKMGFPLIYMGGGEGRASGGHPRSRKGIPAKGYKTRNPKKTTKKFIIERRKK